ncbi:DUF6095 family protein [Flavobacterium rhizosphaerae]|uniref:DUF6095 family protein n=1 Tax=Flavobacterium rhizosphaerae TaxID=3163298 RepID=A0ABW8YVK9_9FLAO
MPTDKKILMRGLRYLFFALPLFFIGPVVIFSSFKNQGHPLFIPVIGLGIICCLTGMWFMFMGIRTIMKSMTD